MVLAAKLPEADLFFPAGNFACRQCPEVAQINLERWPAEKPFALCCCGAMEFRGVTFQSRREPPERVGAFWRSWALQVQPRRVS